MSKRKCLETIFSNFGSYAPSSNGVISQIYLNGSPLIRGRLDLTNGQTHGIKREAARELYELADAIYSGTTRYRKGATFKDIADAVFNILMEYFEQAPSKVDSSTVAAFEGKVDAWFCAASTSTHPYIPCDIIPYTAKPFSIGPIRFTYLAEFASGIQETLPANFVFDQMYEAMTLNHAHWMAELDIGDCLPDRAAEIGDLAVDLALVAVQLVVPLEYSQRIARLHARRAVRMRISVSMSNGRVSSGSTNQQAGRGLDGTVFEQILSENGHLLASFGKRIDAFLNGHGVLPRLNESWNDAAYWFREGIAEPLDTIAVPKLETAIEVLMRSVSSKGSEVRIVQAIKTFYGLAADQMLGPDSIVTVKEFSKGLVRDRSRLLHGTLPTLSTDMRNSRSSLTALAHELLAQFSVELDEYEAAGETKDDIDPFMGWVQARRKASP